MQRIDTQVAYREADLERYLREAYGPDTHIVLTAERIHVLKSEDMEIFGEMSTIMKAVEIIECIRYTLQDQKYIRVTKTDGFIKKVRRSGCACRNTNTVCLDCRL